MNLVTRRSLNLSKLLTLATLIFAWTAVNAAENPSFAPLPVQPGFSLTNGVIVVSPKRLRFGPLPAGKSETNTFLVEIFGGGKVKGTATVPPPFKIISGEKYTLTDKEVQIVTVVYEPERPGTNSALVTFTGGLGAKARVTGRAVAGETALHGGP